MGKEQTTGFLFNERCFDGKVVFTFVIKICVMLNLFQHLLYFTIEPETSSG